MTGQNLASQILIFMIFKTELPEIKYRQPLLTEKYLFSFSFVSCQLTPASQQTLVYQGGPMTAEEAAKFEKLTHFEALIRMRNWDDQGKVKDAPVASLDKYENMCKTFLESVYKNSKKHIEEQLK